MRIHALLQHAVPNEETSNFLNYVVLKEIICMSFRVELKLVLLPGNQFIHLDR